MRPRSLPLIAALALMACTPTHMRLPPDLGPDLKEAVVVGRGDLKPGFTLGDFSITEQTGGWTTGESSMVAGTTSAHEYTPYTFVLLGPGATKVRVACRANSASVGAQVAPGTTVSAVLADHLSCTVGDGLLDLDRPSGTAVHGRLKLVDRLIGVEPVKGIEGSDWAVVSGVRFVESGRSLGAFETMNAGRLVTPASLPVDDQARLAAIAVAILGWPAGGN